METERGSQSQGYQERPYSSFGMFTTNQWPKMSGKSASGWGSKHNKQGMNVHRWPGWWNLMWWEKRGVVPQRSLQSGHKPEQGIYVGIPPEENLHAILRTWNLLCQAVVLAWRTKWTKNLTLLIPSSLCLLSRSHAEFQTVNRKKMVLQWKTTHYLKVTPPSSVWFRFYGRYFTPLQAVDIW